MTRKTTDVLETRIEVKDNGSVKIKKHRTEVEKLGTKGGKSLAGLKKDWIAYAAALTATFVVAKKIVNLAGEQERVEKRLAFAVKSSGVEVIATTGHLTAYASQLQRTTGIGDEAIIPLQTMLIQLGKLSGEGLDRATALTLDFAVAMGVDFKAAGILMAKAAAGSTEALSRYGIVLDEGIPKQEKFNVLLDIMQQKFGGTAEADLETYTGQVRAFKSALGDLGEVIGMSILPGLTAFLGDLVIVSSWLGDILKKLEKLDEATVKVDFSGIVMDEVAQQQFIKITGTATGGEQDISAGDIRAARAQVAKDKLIAVKVEEAIAISEIEMDAQSISLDSLLYFEEQKTKITKEQALMRVEATRIGFQALATLFPKQKAFAVGEALVSTYLGITKALGSAPPPLNFAAAALVAAQGFAAVRSIQSQGISGGGGTSTYSYGGASQSINTPVSGQAQDITLNISGADSLVDKEKLGEMFFDTFGELAESRGGISGNIKINFTEN